MKNSFEYFFYILRIPVLVGVLIFFIWLLLSDKIEYSLINIAVILFCVAFMFYMLVDNVRYIIKMNKRD